MKNKNKMGGLSLLNFKAYHVAMVLRIVGYGQRETHRSMEQKRKSRGRRTQYVQLTEVPKEVNEAKIAFSTNSAGATGYPLAKVGGKRPSTS